MTEGAETDAGPPSSRQAFSRQAFSRQAFSRQAFSRQDALTIGAAIATIALVGMGLSLTFPLLSLRMEAAGVSSRLIGLNAAMGGLATVLGGGFVPRAALAVGVRPLLFVAIVLGAVTLLAFHVFTSFAAWLGLRFLFGISLTILFVLSEYWINAAAPPARRGLVMGIYATVLSLGFAAGPLILTLVGTEGLAPLLTGSVIFLAAAIPVALAGGGTPPIEDRAERSVMSFLRAAPAATLAGLVYGAAETGAFGLLPVYGRHLGFDERDAAGLITVLALGNIVFQIPIGLVADKIDRRKVLLVCAACGALGMFLLPMAADNRLWLNVVLFIWGGIVAALYTVGLALLGARYQGAELATANAAFVILYSLGLIGGPPLFGLGMDLNDPHGLPISIGLLFTAYVGVIGWRFVRQETD
jgi:MFS family permease